MSDRRTQEITALRKAVEIAQSLLRVLDDPRCEPLRVAVASWVALRPRASRRRTDEGFCAMTQNGGKGEILTLTGFKDLKTSSESIDSEPKESQKIASDTNSERHKIDLRPYGTDWCVRFGPDSLPPFPLMGKVLKPLILKHGDDVVRPQWVNFLKASEAQFVNVWRFAQTFGQWDTPNPDSWRRDPSAPRPGESVDAYEKRLAAM